MKELSTEEKAKAYDEAIERAKKLQKTCNSTAVVGWCEYIFPQLKESEDEKIRKALLRWLQSNSYTSIAGIQIKNVIAWFEKQGEHKRFRDSIQVGDNVTKNEYNELINLSQLNRVAKQNADILEKQGNQKPTWSKDDEKKRNLLIGILNVNHPNGHFKVNPIGTTDMEAMSKDELVSWLKSLNKKYTWKPSDDDINLLKEVEQALLGKDCHNRFVDFMWKLKKIK